ncbi:energy transducer TonB [Gracilimonas sediminicola]|uniref:energy transducer TonB n=1 Tax=Gracilimonas sediminicola TaxID=2952158 RepID=UPI0038D45014
MIDKFRDIYYGELEHEHRFMLSLICAELLIICLLKFWPIPEGPPKEDEDTFTDEVIYVENSIITKQTSAPAAPPRPRVPVPVPNDEVIEEEIDFPDFEDLLSKYEADGEDGFSDAQGEGEFVGSPEQPAGLVRIVEPTVPEAAQRANIKARVKVTFLVGTKGQVEDYYISEIRVYDREGNYEVVNQIGYGIMEAVLQAAAKWRFTPAKDDGRLVKTYVENSFNIGF